MTDFKLVPLYDVDRAALREAGKLLDQLDAAASADDPDALMNAVCAARVTYLGGYLAGLADREPDPLTLDRLERRYPLIAWRQPIRVGSPHGSGLACRVCIAVVGLQATETGGLPQTWDAFAEHFREAHDAEPMP